MLKTLTTSVILAAGIVASNFVLPEPAQARTQYGIASWYGHEEHGKLVANYPERYNMYGITAASNTLPLGSCVTITNLRNGKTVRNVRINDRGGFTRLGRIIDVSYGVARRLNFLTAGLTRVKIVKTHRVSRRARSC